MRTRSKSDQLTQGALAPQLTPGNPLFGLGYTTPVKHRRFVRLAGADRLELEGDVAEEAPIAFVYNGKPHAVMMATPADLEDFAIGFTLSEMIAADADEIAGIDVIRSAQGVELQLQIPEARAKRLGERARSLVGRTSCGLCGVELISDVIRAVEPLEPTVQFSAEALFHAESQLAASQPLNSDTRAMHAAAWCDGDGNVLVAREDVGRHNALDKVLGALARMRLDAGLGFIVMTSRASYELVQKVSVARIPLMAAVSRPTGLAIRLAEAAGVALVGLLRDGTANVYADPNEVLKLNAVVHR